MAMLVTRPDDAFCEEAGRIGGALVVDLRGQISNWTTALRRFAWFPAVMLVLVDDDAPSPLDGVGSSLVAANVIDAESGPDRLARQPWVSVLAVELEPDQRPPAWVAVCGKPVIAIRRGVSYADFHEARAACDRLQADLAPEFNLAGYFVAP